jgi:hypothetical protein
MSTHPRQLSAVLAAFILLLVSCAEREPTGVEHVADLQPILNAAADRLPVSQSSSGLAYPIGLCGANVVRILFEGGGTATHAGRFWIENTVCLDQATGAATDGMAVLTAANSDEVHMTFSGQAVAPTELVLTYVIDGGTGRFAHATGELVVDVFLSADLTTFTSGGAGWVAYEASDRADR